MRFHLEKLPASFQLLSINSDELQSINSDYTSFCILFHYATLFLQYRSKYMTASQEIAQFCLAILFFERKVAQLKERLFSIHYLTPELIWNHMVGAKIRSVNSKHLSLFLSKHKSDICQIDLNLVVEVFSSDRRSLGKGDLWEIFKPRTIKCVDEIADCRKTIVSQCYEAHYEITDLLVEIMRETVQFVKMGEGMKHNIALSDVGAIEIEPLDPKHLQVFLNPQCPDLTLKEVELIFSHIIKNQIVCSKSFFEYMIPVSLKVDAVNMNETCKAKDPEQLSALQIIKTHVQICKQVKQSKTKALYLYK